jgi:hypothetical protein
MTTVDCHMFRQRSAIFRKYFRTKERQFVTLIQAHWIIKTNPITALESSWGFQKAEAPSFQEKQHRKMVILSALRTGHLYPQEIFLVLISVRGRGDTVVKVLCYKSEGRWFDPSWCHWNFSFTQNPSDRTVALGSTQPLTEMSTRSRCVRLTTLPPSCAVVMKSGNLNFLEPSGPHRACNGTDLPFTLYSFLLETE